MRSPRLLLVVAIALVAAATPTTGLGAAPVPAAAPWVPDGAARLGPLCRHDTPSFRLWWSDAPGAPGAVAGADGSCATLPPVVADLAASAEAARLRARAMGFPAMTGDAAPAHLRSPALLRALLRLRPATRARSLVALGRPARGSFLAGLGAAQRARVLAGLPRALRGRLLAEVRVARRGRPRDFVGGDRRVDVVIDGTGATGQVQRLQPGLSPCRARQAGRRRQFVAAWAVVLAPRDGPAPRAVLAHELFHVVQCAMGVAPGAPTLVREGTAEWFAALAEPAAFPGPVGAGGTSVTEGNGRAVTFCNGFDPAGAGTAPYASWPVWEVLDPGAPASSAVLAVLAASRGPGGPASPAAVVARVGAGAWAEALRTAAREVCGALRSPSGAVALAPDVRSFLGALAPSATPAAPAALTVPAAGVATVRAVWGNAPAAAVTLRLSSPQVAPGALAASIVVTTAAGPLAPVVREGTVAVDVPASSLGEGSAPVTVAGVSTSGSVVVSVQVVVTPA